MLNLLTKGVVCLYVCSIKLKNKKNMETTMQQTQAVAGEQITPIVKKDTKNTFKQLTYDEFNSPEIQNIIDYLKSKYGNQIMEKDRAMEVEDLVSYIYENLCEMVIKGYYCHYQSLTRILECRILNLIKRKCRTSESLHKQIYNEKEDVSDNFYEMKYLMCNVDFDGFRLYEFMEFLNEKEYCVVETFLGLSDIEDEKYIGQKGLKTLIANKLNINLHGLRSIIENIQKKYQLFYSYQNRSVSI
jgi:hypothetical protein